MTTTAVRTRSLAAIVAALVVALLSLSTAGGEPARAVACPAPTPSTAYTDPAGRALTVTSAIFPICGDPRVIDLTFQTPYVVPNGTGTNVPRVPVPRARVILPAGYATAPATKRYPVLYLLHGGGPSLFGNPAASYLDWTDADVNPGNSYSAGQGRAYSIVQANAAANSGLIVVMPEGAALGEYSDWAWSTSQGNAQLSPRYESWHVGQLVPWIDAAYRTRATAQGRAIGGLSMGGMGAMLYGSKSGKFNTVGSFSGSPRIQDDGSGPFPRITFGATLAAGLAVWGSGTPDFVFGPNWNGFLVRGSGPGWVARDMMTPANIAGLAGKDVTVTTGAKDPSKPRTDSDHCNGSDPAEASICVMNTQWDTARAAQGVATSGYQFIEVAGQGHAWANWNARLTQWLPRVMTKVTPAGP